MIQETIKIKRTVLVRPSPSKMSLCFKWFGTILSKLAWDNTSFSKSKISKHVLTHRRFGKSI